MRVALLFAALTCSCADAHGTAAADFAVVDGSAPEILSCAQSLADYCSQHACVTDLATAETAVWCANMPGFHASYSACDGYVIVRVGGVDSGTGYIYDGATGALSAIVWFSNTQGGCLAGPTTFELQGCRGETRICPTSS